jgi:hypothetical protein
MSNEREGNRQSDKGVGETFALGRRIRAWTIEPERPLEYIDYSSFIGFDIRDHYFLVSYSFLQKAGHSDGQWMDKLRVPSASPLLPTGLHSFGARCQLRQAVFYLTGLISRGLHFRSRSRTLI